MKKCSCLVYASAILFCCIFCTSCATSSPASKKTATKNLPAEPTVTAPTQTVPAQLIASLVVTPREPRVFAIALELKNSNGAPYPVAFLKAQPQASRPKMKIVDAKGKVVAEANFEFG